MRRLSFWLLAIFITAALCWLCPPFRVVPLGQAQQKQRQGAFDAPTFARTFWDQKLLPATARAVPIAELLTGLAQDPAVARQRFGRTLGLSSTFCFFIQGSGQIIAIGKEGVSVAFDDVPPGAGARLSTGLLFGNTLRDATGLLDVNEFPNSQDFNAISAELNHIVESQILPALRNHAAVGRKIRFAGCLELEEGPAPRIVPVIPVQVEWP
jgi:predicted lipoprotein